MNNRIRVARTDNLQNVTDADSLNFVLAEGQPFYDAATKMVYIGDGISTIAQIKADSTKGITSSNVQDSINNVPISNIIESDGATIKNATNVTTSINNVPISDIVESDGSTVKEATNALNVISGGTIASDVTAVTQPITDSSTKVATTEFVNNKVNKILIASSSLTQYLDSNSNYELQTINGVRYISLPDITGSGKLCFTWNTLQALNISSSNLDYIELELVEPNLQSDPEISNLSRTDTITVLKIKFYNNHSSSAYALSNQCHFGTTTNMIFTICNYEISNTSSLLNIYGYGPTQSIAISNNGDIAYYLNSQTQNYQGRFYIKSVYGIIKQ